MEEDVRDFTRAPPVWKERARLPPPIAADQAARPKLKAAADGFPTKYGNDAA